ncbi:hypothetical protein FHX34_107261 [Actinoplanes teichomyceticus]|uniref:Uncharacterized protein n=1 Tax=Actinoplanes teichomyceticus TaxID=1867 RepID=A0A561VGL5_ACTTI|nr:hypothetical protein FHX34_107261 [Actinoplanes teichomyceticus]
MTPRYAVAAPTHVAVRKETDSGGLTTRFGSGSRAVVRGDCIACTPRRRITVPGTLAFRSVTLTGTGATPRR